MLFSRLKMLILKKVSKKGWVVTGKMQVLHPWRVLVNLRPRTTRSWLRRMGAARARPRRARRTFTGSSFPSSSPSTPTRQRSWSRWSNTFKVRHASSLRPFHCIFTVINALGYGLLPLDAFCQLWFAMLMQGSTYFWSFYRPLCLGETSVVDPDLDS